MGARCSRDRPVIFPPKQKKIQFLRINRAASYVRDVPVSFQPNVKKKSSFRAVCVYALRDNT